MRKQDTLVVQVVHRYAHPPARVFDAWLDPATAARFLFVAGEPVRCDIDARVGGGFVMADRRDGGDVEHVGTYLVIERPERLVFTFGIPAESPDVDRVSLAILPAEGGCELTLTTEVAPEWADYLERSRQAWARMLAVLADALA